MTVSVRARTDVVPGLGPAAGMVGQVCVLVVLAATVGLSLAGWIAGAAYAVLIQAMLTRGLYRSGARTLGPANTVTLARAVLVGGVTALVAHSIGHRTSVAVLVTIAAVALALDAVDGQVARRTGSTTELGARFDMEIDAFLILVLSVYVSQSLGWWVLAIGLFRYAFVAAAWPLPWLAAELPPRFSRKVVAAIQGVVLAVAASGLLPTLVAVAAVGAALAVLAWAFGRDVGWLWGNRHVYAATVRG